MQLTKYLFISLFVCHYSFAALVEENKQQEQKIFAVWTEEQREQTVPRAQADFYIQAVNVRTLANLQKYEKKQYWSVARPSHALLAKVMLSEKSKKTFGLSGEQSKKLWDTFPEWLFVSFLKKYPYGKYTFPVRDITDQRIPVFLSLVMNPVYKPHNPYKFLEWIIADSGVNYREGINFSNTEEKNPESVKKNNKRKAVSTAHDSKKLIRSNTI
jgi:hypothetical protein